MSDNPQLEASLLELLEEHNLEEILFALYRYADTQARLAGAIQEQPARDVWEHKACAVDIACEVLDTANRGDED
ncbi:hypothetical protein [Synechococcus sp. PCC 7336]|uniref:hypothetical protein n=1 Tax=Synechococcus sp. PCC 7336 TaxID=195250 RepID=UPI00034C8DBB|nr:hypothetical protein [Synechococcus sp. PCC 7336]